MLIYFNRITFTMEEQMKTGMLTLLIFISFSVSAQTTSTIHEKLKDLAKDANKVSLIVDGKQINFEGKDAATLLKQLKMVSKLESADEDELIWVTKEGDKTHKIISDDDDDNIFFITTDSSDPDSMVTEEIEINDVDGEKEITITTTVNGVKSSKELKGEEAEEYLKNNSEIKLDLDFDTDSGIIKINSENIHKMKKDKMIKVKCCDKKEKEKKIIIKKKIKTEEED